MASNTILTYGGATPASALMGVNPRELSEFDSVTELTQSSADPLERSIRQRLIAKSCILKALVELRFTEANRSRPQQVDEVSVIPGSAIDVYRAPDSKAGAGWHGPAKLLEINKDLGSAIVVWQGRPFSIPLRHIRHHVGYIMSWVFVGHAAQLLS